MRCVCGVYVICTVYRQTDCILPGDRIWLVFVGIALGTAEGATLGIALGNAEGTVVGAALGTAEGTAVGLALGGEEGTAVGVAVGMLGHSPCPAQYS